MCDAEEEIGTEPTVKSGEGGRGGRSLQVWDSITFSGVGHL